MYFYEEGECITNTESALSKPSSFAKEENEKVVYFQNGCMTKLQSRDTTTAFAAMSSAEKAEEADTVEKDDAPLTTVMPKEELNSEDIKEIEAKILESSGSGREQFAPSEQLPITEAAGNTTTPEFENRSDEEDAEETSSAGSITTTADAALTSAQESELKEKAPDNNEDYTDDEEEANAAADSNDSIEAKLDKKGEKASYIK
ncbi:unnamed protein product [Cylicostephanus goldi]|uniref:Uncharacterized protein n=1 Tax=Cylicostephanus goldi TaxID=71465 RepID=A0A3P6QXX0_CYLGO|nr:unnamed protein product [Cylicostephanus goldi]